MRSSEENRTFRPQSEGNFGFLGGEAAAFRLRRLGALRRTDLCPDLGKPGGSVGSGPVTNSTRSHVPSLN